MTDVKTVFDAAGGMPFFEALVGVFYDTVERDPVLLRLYPDQHDLAPARRRLTLFMAQYWGGPTTYSDERGHPRLRARHFPFEVGTDERDHWLAAMRGAIEALQPAPEVRVEIERYITTAAEAMRNKQ